MNERKTTVVDISDPELFNPGFIPLLHDRKRYIHIVGGSGSGKSFFEAQKEIVATFTPRNRLLGVRKVKDTIRDSMYAQLVEVIEMWGMSSYFECTVSPMKVTNKLTGSDIIFRGMDNPEKVKSVTRVTRVWIEEATELTEEDFNQIDLRIRGVAELQITLTYNPIDKDHWLNVRFWSLGENKDTTLHHSTFLSNKWAGDAYRIVLDRLKEQDENMYNIYALGQWGNRVEGLIFTFEEIDQIPESAKLIGHGQDFGFTNDPSACVTAYETDDAYIFDERFYRTRMLNSDIISEYKSLEIGGGDYISGDGAEAKTIEEIYRAGFNIHPAIKGKDSINFGLNLMKEKKIKITKRSANLKKELLNYCYKKDKNGKVLNDPIDNFNHAIDACRYIIRNRKGEVEKPLIFGSL